MMIRSISIVCVIWISCYLWLSQGLIHRKLWTAYNDSFSMDLKPSECQKLYRYNQKPKPIDRDNKYKLWPGLMSSIDLESGDTLFGLEEVSALTSFPILYTNLHYESRLWKLFGTIKILLIVQKRSI